MSKPTEEQMKKAFDICDVDGKGTISCAELEGLFKKAELKDEDAKEMAKVATHFLLTNLFG